MTCLHCPDHCPGAAQRWYCGRCNQDGGPSEHHWHELRTEPPRWRCQRCQMQVIHLDAANAQPCRPTRKGQCRICHEPAMTTTSVYCSTHYREGMRARYTIQHLVTATRPDDEVIALRESGLTYRAMGERLGISTERARQIVGRAYRRRREDL